MVSIEAVLGLASGIVGGAALVVWRGGVLVGKFEAGLVALEGAVDKVRGELHEMRDHLHQVELHGVKTRAKLDSVNGECDSDRGE